MRKLGLIGGVSWTSTARYYEIINTGVHRRLGGLHSARLGIESLDFDTVARAASPADWEVATAAIVGAATRLEQGGADGILICANSMHRAYDAVTAAVRVPVIHIVDVIGARLKGAGVARAALVATSNVMLDKAYRQRLVGQGVSLLPADADLAARIDTIVYDELSTGKPSREAERYMKSELTDIAKADVQAVILACTELEMVVDVRANVLPIYDGTSIHAAAGVDFILDPA